MDPLLAADRLPRVAENAVRRAIVAALSRGRRPAPSVLVNDALIRFERAVQVRARDGIRPALLFAQRDRILRAARTFLDSRVASRLFGVRKRDVLALGGAAKPFDAIVRGAHGTLHAVVFCALPPDGRRLERFRRIRAAAQNGYRGEPLASVVACNVETGRAHTLRVDARRRAA